MSVADADVVEQAASADATSGAAHAVSLPLAIALVSAASLAWQLLLMRWLAIAHWHPFAVMIISLALLGHGASGTWLSVWLRGERRARLHRGFDTAFATCALLFAVSAAMSLVIARVIPFNGLELVWNPRQLLWLAGLFLTLSVPFFFAAACFGLAFARHGSRIPALYGADLIGAAIGALAALAASALPVHRGLLLAAMCGPVAAWLVTRRASLRMAAMIAALALATLWPTQALAPRSNEFKGVSKTLLLPGARVIARSEDPYGSFELVESPRVPLRFAPGLSLSHGDELPPQLAIYTDGDAMSPIVRDDGHADWQWLDDMTSALPYRLRAPDRVLVLGAGGGMDVLQALTLGARQVDAIEQSTQRLRWVRDEFGAYAGHLLDDRRVRNFIAEPRAFVRATPERYDLIVLASGESFASGGAGVQSASEQYALTVEALREYLRTLTPHGVLVATQWSKQPPRDELKLFATAVEALREEGIGDPARNIVAIRNWDASTWLFARAALDPHAVAGVRRFAERRGFDIVHEPAPQAQLRERFHQLDPPTLFDGVQALLSPDARRYIRAYRFDIEPASDDRPYFAHFFRWRSLPELWRLRAQGGGGAAGFGLSGAGGDAGAGRRAGTGARAAAVARLRRDADAVPHSRVRAGAYFLALGLAFLLIEIAMLSRLTLLLGQSVDRRERRACGDAAVRRTGQPARAAMGVGVGYRRPRPCTAHDTRRASHRARACMAVRRARGRIRARRIVAAGVARAAGLHRHRAPGVRDGHAVPARIGAPVAQCAGVRAVAWGLNGCASVVAAILALLLAIAFGLRATLVIALALYVFAAWVWRSGEGGGPRPSPR